MPKLTLSFKGHLLSVHHLEEGPVRIGRETNCRVRIDSLAVAPAHAEILPTEDGHLLLALDSDYPVWLNNEKVDQASLHHGDLIQVGKHTMIFSDDSLELAPKPAPIVATPAAAEEEVADTEAKAIPAYLQAQSGRRIGQVIVLRRAVTRLKRAAAADIIVTKRAGGHWLSRLGGQTLVTVDGEEVTGDAEVALHNSSRIEIAGVRFRFYAGGADATAASGGS